MPYTKIEPTGCGEWHGLVRVRFDLFLEETDARYSERHILVPVIPESGYPGKLDVEGNPINQDDYDAWIASLPRVYQLNPFHTHFLRFEPDVSQDEVLNAINHHIPNFYAAWIQELDKIKGGMRKGWDVKTRKRPRRYDREMTLADYQIRKLACLDKVNLIRASNLSSRSKYIGEVFPATEIDIGAAAIVRGIDADITYTAADKANPANDDGSIDEVEIWMRNSGADVEVATFYVTDTNDLSTRDSEAIGAVTQGAKRTFSALDMDVLTGDYIGIYGSAGDIERDDYDGAGNWYKTGDYIPCTDETFLWDAGDAMSLYGTGATAAQDYPISTSCNLSLAVSIDRDVAWARATSTNLSLAVNVVKSWGRTITISVALSLTVIVKWWTKVVALTLRVRSLALSLQHRVFALTLRRRRGR